MSKIRAFEDELSTFSLETIDWPKQDKGYIIGKHGSQKNKIEKENDVHVHYGSESDLIDTITVTIVGQQCNIEKAKKYIENLREMCLENQGEKCPSNEKGNKCIKFR
ncbi:hypothetical protein SK128_027114 [Halocaridina rubra]|uniref:K Homology domain-containing protein n=1 Tax=Halocaridina rubra TaxID=373956 RepID=A0AAN8X0N9_HALRR